MNYIRSFLWKHLKLFAVILLILSILFLRCTCGFYYLLSGSMSPGYPTGTLMITSTLLRPEIGSVCAYRHNNITVIHRVIDQTDEGYIFKGDANNVADPHIVSEHEIRGRMILAIPPLQNIIQQGETT